MTTPEKKPLVAVNIGTEKDIPTEKLEASAKDAPENQDALQGLSEGVLPPPSIQAVDFSGKKPTMPEGTEWLTRAFQFLDKDKNKGAESQFQNTKFGPALYHGLRLLNSLFGFAFDPGSFNKLSLNLYPTASFGEETKAILKKRLVERYIKLLRSEVTTKSGKNKKLTQLGKIEVRLQKLGMTEEEITKLGGKEQFKDRLAQQTTKLDLDEMIEDDEFKKLMETSEGHLRADSFASAAYVYRELGAAAPLPKEGQTLTSAYDPQSLNAKLQNAKFTDRTEYEFNIEGTDDKVTHNKDNPTMENLYTEEVNGGNVLAAYTAGTLPIGTVVFFRRIGVLMTGIVNLDGKIRYHTKEDLNVLDSFSGDESIGKKVLDVVGKTKTTEDGGFEFSSKHNAEDSETAERFTDFINMFAEGGFAGAFIPNFGPNTQEEVAEGNKALVEHDKKRKEKEAEEEKVKLDKLPEDQKGKTVGELRALAEAVTTGTPEDETKPAEEEADPDAAKPEDDATKPAEAQTAEKKAGDDARADQTADEG
jgi:hypothetical protein